jgi:hypothetical protein
MLQMKNSNSGCQPPILLIFNHSTVRLPKCNSDGSFSRLLSRRTDRQTNFNRPVSRSETGFASLIPIPGSVSGCGV